MENPSGYPASTRQGSQVRILSHPPFSGPLFILVTTVSQREGQGMATIRKRQGKWQVQIRHHGQSGVSKTFIEFVTFGDKIFYTKAFCD